MKHEKIANEFIQNLKNLVENEKNLSNFKSYLSWHFDEWLKKYANTPEDITAETKGFASIL